MVMHRERPLMTVVLVVGVPASGKSTMCRRIGSYLQSLHSLSKNPNVSEINGSQNEKLEIEVSQFSFDEAFPPSRYCIADGKSVDRDAYRKCQEEFLECFSRELHRISHDQSLCQDTHFRRSNVFLVEDVMNNAATRKAYRDRIAKVSVNAVVEPTLMILHMLPSAFIRGKKELRERCVLSHAPSDDLSDLSVILKRNRLRGKSCHIPEDKLLQIFHEWNLPSKKWESKIWKSVRPRRELRNSVNIRSPGNRMNPLEQSILEAINEVYLVRDYSKGEKFHQLHD